MGISPGGATLGLTSTHKAGHHLSHTEALFAHQKVAKVIPLGETCGTCHRVWPLASLAQKRCGAVWKKTGPEQVIWKPLKSEFATDESKLMNKLCIVVGMTIAGSVGWWIGTRIGFITGFILSCIGSMIGVYLGWRINRHYFG